MVEITSPKTETSVGVNLTVDTVQYWCHHTQQFAKTQVEKAKKFVENNCYEYNGEGFFCATQSRVIIQELIQSGKTRKLMNLTATAKKAGKDQELAHTSWAYISLLS